MTHPSSNSVERDSGTTASPLLGTDTTGVPWFEFAALPWEVIEGNENHGPYIANAYGATVCDLYAMSNPAAWSVRNGGDSKPIWFADAADNAKLIDRAVNAYAPMLAALENIVSNWGDLHRKDRHQARAAITLATGAQS